MPECKVCGRPVKWVARETLEGGYIHSDTPMGRYHHLPEPHAAQVSERRIAYDIELMRPGCALVAAGLGADTAICGAFETEDWLMTPTPGMRIYTVTPEQLRILVLKTEAVRVA